MSGMYIGLGVRPFVLPLSCVRDGGKQAPETLPVTGWIGFCSPKFLRLLIIPDPSPPPLPLGTIPSRMLPPAPDEYYPPRPPRRDPLPFFTSRPPGLPPTPTPPPRLLISASHVPSPASSRQLTEHGPGLFISQHLPDMSIPAGRGGGRRGARSSGGGSGSNSSYGGWGNGDGARPTPAVLGDLEWDLGEEPAVLVWDGDGVGGVEVPNPSPETRPICLQVRAAASSLGQPCGELFAAFCCFCFVLFFVVLCSFLVCFGLFCFKCLRFFVLLVSFILPRTHFVLPCLVPGIPSLFLV